MHLHVPGVGIREGSYVVCHNVHFTGLFSCTTMSSSQEQLPAQGSGETLSPQVQETPEDPARAALQPDGDQVPPEDPSQQDLEDDPHMPVPFAEREKELRTARWSGTATINQQWYQAVGMELKTEQLAWDTRKEFGQTRPVDDVHVSNLFLSLQERPPVEPLRVIVWHNIENGKYYLLSGQHLTKALGRVRQSRSEEGLSIAKWMTTVRADVLKYECPRKIREVVSGASNASTRVIRATKVSECLSHFLQLAQDSDAARPLKAEVMHTLMQSAIEAAGLNVDKEKPVCDPQAVCSQERASARFFHQCYGILTVHHREGVDPSG